MTQSSIGRLFRTAFAVGTCFNAALGALGLLVALIMPGFFKVNMRPAADPVEALGVLAIMLLGLVVVNALSSAIGSLIWAMVRPRKSAKSDVFS